MFVCPLCNAITQQHFSCPNCGQEMKDEGRVMDFFDDYSAYLDIEGMKLFNGYPDDQKNHLCPHVLSCSNCSKEIIHFIEEIDF